MKKLRFKLSNIAYTLQTWDSKAIHNLGVSGRRDSLLSKLSLALKP